MPKAVEELVTNPERAQRLRLAAEEAFDAAIRAKMAKRLRAGRGAPHWLAGETKMGEGSISRLMNGSRGGTLASWRALAKAIGVELEWLLDGTGPKRRTPGGAPGDIPVWPVADWLTSHPTIAQAFEAGGYGFEDAVYIMNTDASGGGPGGNVIKSAADVHKLLESRHARAAVPVTEAALDAESDRRRRED